MKTPQEHIERALRVEKEVKEKDMPLYLDCMNHKPMSQRKEEQEIRDGCILTSVFLWCVNPDDYDWNKTLIAK